MSFERTGLALQNPDIQRAVTKALGAVPRDDALLAMPKASRQASICTGALFFFVWNILGSCGVLLYKLVVAVRHQGRQYFMCHRTCDALRWPRRRRNETNKSKRSYA